MKTILEKPFVFKEKIESVINSSWITRLFNWQSILILLSEIKAIVYDAMQINERLLVENSNLQETLTIKQNNVDHCNEEIRSLKSDNKIFQERINHLTPLAQTNKELQEIVNKYEQKENSRNLEHKNSINQLDATQQKLNDDIQRRINEQEQARSDAWEEKRKTWKSHQDLVQTVIKHLCDLHGIAYIDSFPFEGKSPDNTIQIVNDYVIFDAKAPYNDNLDNFPTYIKNQVSSIGKYGKYKSVHKHLYLVIPSNTAEVIKEKVYRDSSYTVHVITLDSLETILLSLKQREIYECFETLGPEDSEGIARVVSGLMSFGKRTVQVNTFFNDWLLNFLKDNIHLLPEDILQQATEMELGQKINPANQKSNELIDLDEETTKNEAVKTIALHQAKVNSINQINIKEDEK
ncbi:MAG: hypothetical protein VX762_01035 [Bacteroidota bacterium]|nr:hypothetical protein [Bacteroidota bacterium]